TRSGTGRLKRHDMILQTESEEVIRLLPEHHILSDRIFKKTQKNDNKKMAYEDDRPLSLRMPSYFGGHLLNIPN
ncbi:hypothetical protein, partial [Phocaeicola sp.]|uniref:hypothetical protein n=1 Tax=Phocaeicola sp. TaxID=2773926 RepID=UPI003AB3546B